VNLSNNASNLDVQNGVFTVFGQVLGDGMDVVDSIAALSRFNFGNAFIEIPLRDYSTADANNNVVPDDSNIVIISDIVVIDSASVTNPDLRPPRNSSNNPVSMPTPPANDSSGGTLNILLLIGLCAVSAMRAKKL